MSTVQDRAGEWRPECSWVPRSRSPDQGWSCVRVWWGPPPPCWGPELPLHYWDWATTRESAILSASASNEIWVWENQRERKSDLGVTIHTTRHDTTRLIFKQTRTREHRRDSNLFYTSIRYINIYYNIILLHKTGWTELIETFAVLGYLNFHFFIIISYKLINKKDKQTWTWASTWNYNVTDYTKAY